MQYWKIPSWLSVSAAFGLLSIARPTNAQAAETNFAVAPAVSTNLAGSVINLRLLALNPGAQPSAIQWSLNGVPLVDADRVSGATSDELRIVDCAFTDSGTYRASVTWTAATPANVSAVVYVVAPPAIQGITGQSSGDDVVLTAEATGGFLSYQWTWQGTALAGATTSTLRLVNAYNTANAGYYSVQVTNAWGSAVATPGYLFTKPAPAGTYQGLFSETNGVAMDSAGFFQCKVNGSKSSFSGKVTIGRQSYSFSGVFQADHQATVTATGKAGSLALRLQMLTVDSTPQVIGTIKGGSWLADLRANRLHFSSKLQTLLVGKYTLGLLNTNTTARFAHGHGFATLTVKPNGNLIASGQLPDGRTFSQSCGLSRTGDWPLYASLGKEEGALQGWLRIARPSSTNIQGSPVAWLKAPGATGPFPAGFGQVLLPIGSFFAGPSSGMGINYSTGIATVFGGDLVSGEVPVWESTKVTANPPSSFVGEPGGAQVRINMNRANGKLSGSFVHFLTGLKTPVKGVILQQQNVGRGYFLSSGLSGSFSLDPPP